MRVLSFTRSAKIVVKQSTADPSMALMPTSEYSPPLQVLPSASTTTVTAASDGQVSVPAPDWAQRFRCPPLSDTTQVPSRCRGADHCSCRQLTTRPPNLTRLLRHIGMRGTNSCVDGALPYPAPNSRVAGAAFWHTTVYGLGWAFREGGERQKFGAPHLDEEGMPSRAIR